MTPRTRRLPLHALTLLSAALLAIALVVLPARTAHADASIELKGQVGMASATHDRTDRIPDPVFGLGGGGMVAALIDLGGFWVGLDFRYWIENHAARLNSASAGEMLYSVPSAGIKVRFDLLPSVAAAIWANYAFGSACTTDTAGNETASWSAQGLDAGVEANYNYKLDPYKTYIQFGIFIHYQYLLMLTDVATSVDATSNNIGAGINLGVRFDMGF